MNALMESYPIDKKPVNRMDMTGLIDRMKDADNIDGLTPIDIHSPDHLQHYFANGSYVREMILPENVIVVGRIHKHESINILLEGDITVIDENGTRTDFKAPHIFVAPAGNQKAAITRTPIRWLNSWACETTNPEEAIELLTCETIEEYNNFISLQEELKLENKGGS